VYSYQCFDTQSYPISVGSYTSITFDTHISGLEVYFHNLNQSIIGIKCDLSCENLERKSVDFKNISMVNNGIRIDFNGIINAFNCGLKNCTQDDASYNVTAYYKTCGLFCFSEPTYYCSTYSYQSGVPQISSLSINVSQQIYDCNELVSNNGGEIRTNGSYMFIYYSTYISIMGIIGTTTVIPKIQNISPTPSPTIAPTNSPTPAPTQSNNKDSGTLSIGGGVGGGIGGIIIIVILVKSCGKSSGRQLNDSGQERPSSIELPRSSVTRIDCSKCLGNGCDKCNYRGQRYSNGGLIT